MLVLQQTEGDEWASSTSLSSISGGVLEVNGHSCPGLMRQRMSVYTRTRTQWTDWYCAPFFLGAFANCSLCSPEILELEYSRIISR
jgi:hypothetical protein